MATTTPSQAVQTAALLTKASESLLDAWVALSDVLEIADKPDGEKLPQQEALALVGLTALSRRHVAWVVG